MASRMEIDEILTQNNERVTSKKSLTLKEEGKKKKKNQLLFLKPIEMRLYGKLTWFLSF